MKLSNHGKRRMRERTPFNHNIRKTLFSEALRYGKSPDNVSDENIRKFLKSKRNCKVKLYRDYVFIYSKNSHRLYTMYKLPEELINSGKSNDNS